MSEPRGWRERWIAWRNARLQDPKFQRFAADFPLTRGIAHRRAAALFDLVAGFVYSQVLMACIRLDLLNALKNGLRTSAELASEANIPEPAMSRLLRAAASLELVEEFGGRYALGPQGAALIGNAGLADMIRHHDKLYADLADPVELLKRGKGEQLAGYWPYATSAEPDASAEGAISPYSALMGATQPGVASDVLAAYPMRRHRVVLDVGGGEGAFLEAVGARWPHLKLHLFDLPAVVERARDRLAPLMARTHFTGGDFLSGMLPRGADLTTLIRILHDHDDAGVARILASVKDSLAPGGRILIAEPMAAPGGRDRVADAYFGLYLFAMGRGQARTPRAIGDFLLAAGFRNVRLLRTRTPGLLRVVVADS